MKLRIGILLIAMLVILGGFTIAASVVPDSEPFITSELGPLQVTQGLVMVAAFVVAFRLLLRDGFGKPVSGMSAGVAFTMFFLAWREIEIDDHISKIHAFSWKYLWSGEVSMGVALAWGIPSLIIAGAAVYYTLKERDAIWHEFFHRWPTALRLIPIAAIALLAVSQIWDKHRTLADHFGVMGQGRERVKDPLIEELLELAGQMTFLFFTFEYTRWRNAVRGQAVTPLAAEPVKDHENTTPSH